MSFKSCLYFSINSDENTTAKKLTDQELIGLGFANIGAAFSSGFVVSGSLSRGVVIRRAGGRTQIVSIVNGILVTLTIFFVLKLFFNLPFVILAAIVIQFQVLVTKR